MQMSHPAAALLLALAAITGAAAAPPDAASQAASAPAPAASDAVRVIGGIEKSTEYYADSGHTRLVGELITGCGRRPWRWGRTTSYTVPSEGPCGAGDRRQDTVAAHLLRHADPLAACQLRCDRKPLTVCGPDDPPETCGAGPRLACKQACQDAYSPEDGNP